MTDTKICSSAGTPGLLLVISGPAGSGKGTVTKMLLESGMFEFSVSATTRAPRPGEVNGVNYHYITKEEFLSRIASGDMLEYTTYCENYYGTPRKEAEAVLASGKNLILEIEVKGASNVKKKYPEAVLIMLLPPSHSVQEERLRARGTETEENLRLRLARAKEEIYSAPLYDYVVYNHTGRADEAAELIMSIVRAENASTKRRCDIVERFLST